jgi:hypothetical protein
MSSVTAARRYVLKGVSNRRQELKGGGIATTHLLEGTDKLLKLGDAELLELSGEEITGAVPLANDSEEKSQQREHSERDGSQQPQTFSKLASSSSSSSKKERYW